MSEKKEWKVGELGSGKVIWVHDLNDSYPSQGGGELHNFGIAIEGIKEQFFISVKDKTNPGVSVGDVFDFEIKANKKGEPQHKFATVSGRSLDLIKIGKQKQNTFGGGGGGKRYPKTKEEYENDAMFTAADISVKLVTSRHDWLSNKTPEDTVGLFGKLYDGIISILRKSIK